MKEQNGFIASILIFAVLVVIVLWVATNHLIPQVTEKCHAKYGNDWAVVFQGDFMCKNANGDLKSVR